MKFLQLTLFTGEPIAFIPSKVNAIFVEQQHDGEKITKETVISCGKQIFGVKESIAIVMIELGQILDEERMTAEKIKLDFGDLVRAEGKLPR